MVMFISLPWLLTIARLRTEARMDGDAARSSQVLCLESTKKFQEIKACSGVNRFL